MGIRGKDGTGGRVKGTERASCIGGAQRAETAVKEEETEGITNIRNERILPEMRTHKQLHMRKNWPINSFLLALSS